MGASNTPLYDLIELSGISANTTYTTAAGGGGDILGLVDNATYTDTSGLNTATEIIEINDTTDADNGTLTIDGVTYDIDIYTPNSTNYADRVTITYNNGASTAELYGDSGLSQIAWIVATPQGGGPTRYFTAIQDDVGNLPDITSIQVRGLDTDPAGDDVKINLDQNNTVTACLVSGTLVATPSGERPVEALRPGDLVLTLDTGPQPVLWAGRRAYGPRDLALNPHMRPVRVPEGVLGAVRPLMVSPQHCLLLNSRDPPDVQRLVRAKHLAEASGPLRVARGIRHVCYHHILLQDHHLVRANGVATESFYPGLIGLSGLHPADRLAVLALLPGLADRPVTQAYGPTARPVLKRREALTLPRLRRTVSAR